MIWQKNGRLRFKIWLFFFLSCRFPKPVIHYWAKKLMICSNHPWIMLNIWDEKWSIYPQVPSELSSAELEGLVCKVISLTGNNVNPDSLEVCHRLKKKDNVIIKFKSWKLKYTEHPCRSAISIEWKSFDFQSNCKATLLKSHFGMSVLL